MLHAINTTSILLPLYRRHKRNASRAQPRPLGSFIELDERLQALACVYVRDRDYAQRAQPRTLRMDPDPT